jgi:hypothetical protein
MTDISAKTSRRDDVRRHFTAVRLLAQALLEDVLPTISLQFVDESLHRAAISAYLAASRRGTAGFTTIP